MSGNRNPQQRRRPGGGFGSGQEEENRESEEIVRPDAEAAVSQIDRALADDQQESRRPPCGCW